MLCTSKFSTQELSRIRLILNLFSSPVRNVWNNVKNKKFNPLKGHFNNHKFLNKYKQGRFREIRNTEELDVVSKLPKKYTHYDEEFAKVTSFENQMQSLKLQGFQRPYRPYNPPKNMERKFVETCQSALGDKFGEDFSKVELQGLDKVKVLSALTETFNGHRVPNSLLHTMTSLDKVFTFYSTSVDKLSPYDRLELGVSHGVLPQNLHVQIDPVRFDPADVMSTNDLGRISAYPKMSTILTTPESQRKWAPYKAKHSPYKNSKNDDYNVHDDD